MSLSMDHALRRRQGVAPSSLVMARAGTIDGEAGPVPDQSCPVRGCGESMSTDAMQQHLALAHPRHRLGEEARRELLYAAG